MNAALKKNMKATAAAAQGRMDREKGTRTVRGTERDDGGAGKEWVKEQIYEY